MKIRPITINGNLSPVEFKSCTIDELTILIGGYIITPRGEIIVVDETEEHCNVFSDYINIYLEQSPFKTYDTATATKILCEIGCCVYAGIRYREYIANKTESFDNEAISLNFPQEINKITSIQKEACKKIIASNTSIFGDREKIFMNYGGYPDTVYTKDQILKILTESSKKELNSKILDLSTLKLEPVDYNKKEHLNFIKNLMQSKDIYYLWDLADSSLINNQNTSKYIILNESLEKIGYVNYSDPTEAIYGNTVSLYYAIDEKYRGQEYGKRIIEEISNWLFFEKGIDCIIAQADVKNIYSINTLLKAGMTRINEDEEYTTFIQRKNR